MGEAWVGVLTVIMGSGIAGLVSWLVARQNRQSVREVKRAETQVEKRRLDIAGLETLVTKLEAQIERQDRKIQNQDTRIQLLESHRSDDADRIDGLERSLDQEGRRSHAAIRYIRSLLDWVAQHMPGASPPEIPVLLREDLT